MKRGFDELEEKSHVNRSQFHERRKGADLRWVPSVDKREAKDRKECEERDEIVEGFLLLKRFLEFRYHDRDLLG